LSSFKLVRDHFLVDFGVASPGASLAVRRGACGVESVRWNFPQSGHAQYKVISWPHKLEVRLDRPDNVIDGALVFSFFCALRLALRQRVVVPHIRRPPWAPSAVNRCVWTRIAAPIK